MKGDFTRDTFDSGKHFLRVLMQQGRVQVDADWNEQVAILLHYMQTLAADLIGPPGGPIANCGFSILDGNSYNFGIGKGRYYVDGILCENQATPVSITSSKTTAGQTEITVSSISPDGFPFHNDEYVEIFTLNKPAQRGALAKINVDVKNKVLRLEKDVSVPLGADAAVRRADTYQTQPDFPKPPELEHENYLVYLDVWERHISHLEDEAIREVALGGPDTASRSKVIWQVKVYKLGNANPSFKCKDAFGKLAPLPLSSALLKAQTEKPGPPAMEEPCVLPPEVRYRGMENRLYRVEIHRSGDAWKDGTLDKRQPAGNADQAATFKWSRDDGSVILAVKKIGSGAQPNTIKVELASLGAGCEISLAVGDWVEIVDDDSVLMNEAEPEPLLNVIAIDQIDKTVTLDGVTKVISPSEKHPLLRRWDFIPKGLNAPKQANDKALLIEEGKWLTLENGIQIWFVEKAADNPQPLYRTGDYWLIPARVETGDVEWPEQMDASGKPLVDEASKSAAKALSPRGVLHHYAPLAILSVDGTTGSTTVKQSDDCRCEFGPICIKEVAR